jgi:hypothetical protein
VVAAFPRLEFCFKKLIRAGTAADNSTTAVKLGRRRLTGISAGTYAGTLCGGRASESSDAAPCELQKERIVKKLIFAALASVSLLSSMARAQALRPTGGGPAISPYLNLARPGINPALNYFGSVRPQLTYNAAINTLEQQVTASRVAITAQETLNVPTTGHPIYFLNYQRYFLTTGVQAPFQNLQATAGAGAITSSAGARAFSSYSAPGAPGAYNSGMAPIAPTAGSYRRY